MEDMLNRLRERPKEDRHTIATTIAVIVVVILLGGWFLYFMHKITRGQLEYQATSENAEEIVSEDIVPEQATSAAPSVVPVSPSATTTYTPSVEILNGL